MKRGDLVVPRYPRNGKPVAVVDTRWLTRFKWGGAVEYQVLQIQIPYRIFWLRWVDVDEYMKVTASPIEATT